MKFVLEPNIKEVQFITIINQPYIIQGDILAWCTRIIVEPKATILLFERG
jgi:hypothetical protein